MKISKLPKDANTTSAGAPPPSVKRSALVIGGVIVLAAAAALMIRNGKLTGRNAAIIEAAFLVTAGVGPFEEYRLRQPVRGDPGGTSFSPKPSVPCSSPPIK